MRERKFAVMATEVTIAAFLDILKERMDLMDHQIEVEVSEEVVRSEECGGGILFGCHCREFRDAGFYFKVPASRIVIYPLAILEVSRDADWCHFVERVIKTLIHEMAHARQWLYGESRNPGIPYESRPEEIDARICERALFEDLTVDDDFDLYGEIMSIVEVTREQVAP